MSLDLARKYWRVMLAASPLSDSGGGDEQVCAPKSSVTSLMLWNFS